MKLPNEIAKADPRIRAIRKDKNVGIGSCTTIDECWSHGEILEFLNNNNIISIKKAVEWAYAHEGLIRSVATNYSSGEPDCRLIKEDKDWNDIMNKK